MHNTSTFKFFFQNKYNVFLQDFFAVNFVSLKFHHYFERRYHHKKVGRVAQSVQRLTTGWTVRGSNPGGGEIFRTCLDRPWGSLSLLYNAYRSFPGLKSGRGVTLTPHSLLVPWSRKSRAIPLLPVWSVRPVQSLSACTRVHFNFTFYDHKKWS